MIATYWIIHIEAIKTTIVHVSIFKIHELYLLYQKA